MRGKQTRELLTARLEHVNAAIAAHPFASDRVMQANEIIESNKGATREDIDRLLAERGLPSLAEGGLIVVRGTGSWWKLHRDKKKLEAKLAKLDRE